MDFHGCLSLKQGLLSVLFMETFTVNKRAYRLPDRPVAVICVDGCEEAYLDVALAQGRMPHFSRILEIGWRVQHGGRCPLSQT